MNRTAKVNMQNTNTKIFSRTSFKPSRLIWQEAFEEFPSNMDAGNRKKLQEEMRADLRKISRPGEEKEDSITLEAFLEKHKDLLLQDVDLFSEVLDHFSPMGIEAFKKVVEFGNSYLQSSPPAAASYIYDVLTTAVYLYKNNPDLAKQAQEDIKKFVESFVKEKAGPILDNDAIFLAETIRTFAENEKLLPQMSKFLEDKIKKFDLSDGEFGRIITIAVADPRLPRCYESVSQILYQSEDKPFINIVSFGEAVGWAVLSGDSKLFKFVLQRGRDIVGEKEGKEYVEKALTGVDKKSSLRKDWKTFLKENAESFDKQKLANLLNSWDIAALTEFLDSLKKERGSEFVSNAIVERLSDCRFSIERYVRMCEKYLRPEDLVPLVRSTFENLEKENRGSEILMQGSLGKYLEPAEANKIFTNALKSSFTQVEYGRILQFVPKYRAYIAPEVLEKTLKDVLDAVENSEDYHFIIKHLKDYYSGISDDGFVKEKVNSALDKASAQTILGNISELKKPEFEKYVARVDLKTHLKRAILETVNASTLVIFEDDYKDFFSQGEFEALFPKGSTMINSMEEERKRLKLEKEEEKR